MNTLQIQRHMKLRPLPQLAVNLDATLHLVHNVFCNGHTQSAALCLPHTAIVLPDKRFKYDLLELRRHADAVVFHPKVRADIAVPPGRCLLCNCYIDRAAFRRKLDGIGQQVQQHLIQPYAVAVDLLGQDIADGNIKCLFLGFDLRLDNIDNTLHGLPQGEGLHVQRQLSTLHL